MLKQGEQDGIKQVICTPHILSKQDMDREDEVIALFETLKTKACSARISMELHLGSELYVQPDLELDRRISTLAQNGRYFLVEFSMGMIPDFVAKRFFEMTRSDQTAIIAHPERYSTLLNNPDKARDFVARGALLQINAGSLLGVFGTRVKTLSERLMDANLVHFVASDAHDCKMRPLKLSEAYRMVEQKWGGERARDLMVNNPLKVLAAEPIRTGTYQPVESPAKPSIRERLRSVLSK